MNQITLLGRLTRDPELRMTPSGSQVCRFSVACNEKTKQGTEAYFFDVDAWGESARNIEKFFGKGKPILVIGKLRQNKWKDKEGNNRTNYVVAMDRFEFVPGDMSGDGAPAQQQPQPQQRQTGTQFNGTQFNNGMNQRRRAQAEEDFGDVPF